MEFSGKRIEQCGEFKILSGNSTRIVCGQVNRDTVVDVGPFRVMIHALNGDGGGRHEAKGVNEIGEFIFLMKLAIDDGPTAQRFQRGGDLGLCRLMSHDYLIVVVCWYLMSQLLPRLRGNLDLMPSPVEDRPGLLIRDGYHYTPTTLIIPPLLAACLELFDGQHSVREMKDRLYELTDDLEASGLADHLLDTLDKAGFLENETYFAIRDDAHRGFAETPVRYAAHSGTGYPGDAVQLNDVFGQYMSDDAGIGPLVRPAKLIGIAAPHVSPFGGWESYQAAYRLLTPADRDRVFVVLGTSHYGEPDRFGLTRKPYLTPYGAARTEVAMVDRLEKEGGAAVAMEDYCHSFEHSIEFQIAFLQHMCGPDIRILPILCGSFARSIYEGGKPEANDDVKRFLGALGDLNAREADRLMWVLGIDMAHMGNRYEDQHPAVAGEGEMVEVEQRDRNRIQSMNAGEVDAFWSQVQGSKGDDLKWCGSSPVYTFMKAVPEARGLLQRYQQWNIDEQSVVSFAGIAYQR